MRTNNLTKDNEMKNKKHTNGPWMPTANFHQNGMIVVADNAKEHEGTAIASIPNFRCYEDAEANATLIAAAPDLLEALESTYKELNRIREAKGLDSKSHEPNCVSMLSLGLAEEALKKAKGGTS